VPLPVRQVKGAHGYLFPKNFKVPPSHLGLEHGGLLNWLQPLSNTMPVFAAQLAATQEYLHKMQLVPRVATAEQGDASQDDALYCEACRAQLHVTARGVCANPACEIVCCAQCLRMVGQEQFCASCVEAAFDDGEQAES
jgi:hypothetical protein